MNYRDMLGFPKSKKKVVKEQPKKTKNKLIESINEEIHNYPIQQFNRMKEESDKEITNIPDSPFEKDNEDVKKESNLNETLPSFPKEWKNLEKAEKIYEKAVMALGKAVGKVDKSHAKTISGLWSYVGSPMKKFKELITKEVLDKLQ